MVVLRCQKEVVTIRHTCYLRACPFHYFIKNRSYDAFRNDMSSWFLVTPNRRRSSGTGGKGPQDKFDLAEECLHVSAVPKSLPCRDSERKTLLSFLKSNIKGGT